MDNISSFSKYIFFNVNVKLTFQLKKKTKTLCIK